MSLPALRLTDPEPMTHQGASASGTTGAGGETAAAHDSEAMIRAWTRSLGLLLRLPREVTREITDEISQHLDDRVRDLMVGGLSERAAAERAISELGDVAEMARRFREVHGGTPRRRLMNLMTIGAAALALTGAGLVSMQQRGVSTISVYQPAAREPAPLALRWTATAMGDLTWGQFFASVEEQTGRRVSVQWSSLRALHETIQIDISEGVVTDLRGVSSLDEVLEYVNNDLNLIGNNRVEYRIESDVGGAGGGAVGGGGALGGGGAVGGAERIVVASTAYFDHRETTLATYDLKDVVQARLGESSHVRDLVEIEVVQIRALIQDMVEPQSWAENGGDRASMWSFGTKLFVRAPQRLRSQIEWVLSELPRESAASASADTRAGVPVLKDVPLVGSASRGAAVGKAADLSLPAQLREVHIGGAAGGGRATLRAGAA